MELVQLRAGHYGRTVAPLGEPDSSDLIVAIGGDGTVLTALRAAAATGAPVLGVACGSLGVLTAIAADRFAEALALFQAGTWTPRSLPALDIAVDGEDVAWALNDFVVVRRAGQQLVVNVTVGGELYARLAGDGMVVATPIGSSAYSMAAGGPLVVAGSDALVVTPLVIHGASAPPIVVPAPLEVELEVLAGFGGFDVEIDGRGEPLEGTRFTARLTQGRGTLVAVDDPGLGIEPLRHRGLIADSPRVIARDERERAAGR